MFRKKKTILERAFETPSDPLFLRVNNFFALLTLVSVIAIVLQTVPGLYSYQPLFTTIEWVTVAFFTFEYFARIYIAPNKIKYIFSFFGLIDLVSILPTYMGLTNLTFLKTARTLRLLRFFRILRLVKVVRTHTNKANKTVRGLNMKIYFMTLIVSALLFGTLIYLIESTHQEFTSIPEGMLWALQIILADPSFARPETVAGESIVLLARFVSFLLFGLLINVVGFIVKKILFGTEELE